MHYSVLFLFVYAQSACANRIPDYRIVQGVDIPIEEAPYQVSLVTTSNFHFCGGTLVEGGDEVIVITAAHCVVDVRPGSVFVRAGNELVGKGDIKGVRKVVVHQNYDGDSMESDIALLFLEEPFQLSERIVPAVLPEMKRRAINGEELLVSGWGRLTDGGQTSDTLQGVVLPIIDNEQCQKLYKPLNQLIFPSQLCTYLYSKDACQGDSGGPAAKKIGDDYILIGIVSWGIGCAKENIPGVFTRVSEFIPWILEKLEEGNTETSGYLYSKSDLIDSEPDLPIKIPKSRYIPDFF